MTRLPRLVIATVFAAAAVFVISPAPTGTGPNSSPEDNAWRLASWVLGGAGVGLVAGLLGDATRRR